MADELPKPEPRVDVTGVPLLRIEGVTKKFGVFRAVDRLSLDIRAGEFFALLGPSGCGKTTLLRILAGLQRPTAGEVRLAGVPVVRPEPQVCLVFQHYADTLLPWKRAVDNVLFGLRAGGVEARQLRETALALLDRMGLAGDAERYPWELSGGMQQRVVLARALIRRPRVLLLDEPFSAVDERTRASLQELLLTLHREDTCSIVLVSHNLEEVLHLSRRIVVLTGRPARVEQVIEGPAGLTREALRSRLSIVRRRP
jgi:ABC-type nitrate/sulfonate/bicarbonate transport system ATPase subunit